MKFKRQLVVEESVNLTPLIDVVFLLLIFFMVSTTFTKETHLSIDLPEASGEVTQQSSSIIELLVNATGEYSVNQRKLAGQELSIIKEALEEQSEGDNSLPLIITADANASHQSVVRAMDAAGQLGFTRLSITTMHPKNSSRK